RAFRSPGRSGPCAIACEWGVRRRPPGLSVARRSCGGIQVVGLRRNRQGDGEDGAWPVAAVGGQNGAPHRFDEAARDGEAEAGAGADLVSLAGAVELVENALPVLGRNAVALVDDLEDFDVPVAPAPDADRGA